VLHWLESALANAISFDVIHASVPCQRYSRMSNCRPGLAADYPDLIGPVRELLQRFDCPWVLENVEGAPLRDPVTLCGLMFGRELHRHRLFETNFHLPQPPHPAHTMPTSRAGHWQPGTVMSLSGHVAPIAKARELMGIDWMRREEMMEAIPPYMTEYVGKYMMEAL
jgi:DNA (cytosine-5)-methyltransferase 1